MQDFMIVEHRFHPVDALFPLYMLLAVESGPVPGPAKQHRKTRFKVFSVHGIARIAVIPVCRRRQSREES